MVAEGTDGTSPSDPIDGTGVPVIRIQKGEVKPKMGGVYFFVWPIFLSILVIVISMIWYPGGLDSSLVLILVINTVLALIYTSRNIKPALGFELSLEHASLYYLEKDEEAQLAMGVPLDDRTVVDVVLNETTTSEEYGNLYGWTFENGTDKITVSAFDDWELWDIQSLREPIYQAIEQNGLRMGRSLIGYREG